MADATVSTRPVRVLVLGQTPPPYHGQSLMIEAMLRGPMQGVELRHVRMAYSREMDEIGRPTAAKILHMMGVVARTWREQARFRPDVVYYPPCGPNFVPATRDVFTLLAIRPFSRRLILQFHAGGISELLDRRWPAPGLRRLFRWAFSRPDAAIMLGPSAPPDGRRFGAQRLYFVPNGIEDPTAGEAPTRPGDETVPTVLFVGVLLESKGVVVLARAAAELWRAGRPFRLVYVGRYTPQVERAIRTAVAGYEEHLELTGVLTGDDKWKRFAEAAVFCYPSTFNSEVMPVACVEAMAFGLPVVAARWRAIPDLVDDGRTGFLLPSPEPAAIAERLDLLLSNPDLRASMGTAARRKFERSFTLERSTERIRRVFLDVAGTS